MRRLATLLLVLALAACAVPRERDDTSLDKAALEPDEVTEVFDRYREVRNTAISLLDPKPLSTVESGPVLAIDSGSFEVAQRLRSDRSEQGDEDDVRQVAAPRFSKYPLWFMAEVRDTAADVNRVQVFERTSAVDPWLLVATPETVLSTELPELRTTDGAALAVAPGSDAGLSMSAQGAADAYAAALADPEAPEARTIERDDFLEQMRAAAEQNRGLDGVKYRQSWAAEEVRHVLRTADGGALAFVTLLRLDTYEVEDGVTVTWPEDSPQKAFLSTGISTSGRLRYYHQVLVHLPGGGGKPRALGQYGGVVDAEGF